MSKKNWGCGNYIIGIIVALSLLLVLLLLWVFWHWNYVILGLFISFVDTVNYVWLKCQKFLTSKESNLNQVQEWTPENLECVCYKQTSLIEEIVSISLTLKLPWLIMTNFSLQQQTDKGRYQQGNYRLI